VKPDSIEYLQRVKEWFRRKGRRPKVVKPGKMPHARQVISVIREAEIKEQMLNFPNMTILAAHAKSVAHIMKSMTAEEKREVDRIRVEWMNKGPPKSEQRR
jgi:hypothetical protein